MTKFYDRPDTEKAAIMETIYADDLGLAIVEQMGLTESTSDEQHDALCEAVSFGFDQGVTGFIYYTDCKTFAEREDVAERLADWKDDLQREMGMTYSAEEIDKMVWHFVAQFLRPILDV